LRPTPGSATSSSSEPGTWPACFSTSARGQQRPRLLPVETARENQALDGLGPRAGELARGREAPEERGGQLVHHLVGRLRREDRGDEQLEGIAVAECAVGVRMRHEQALRDPARALGAHSLPFSW
jgi:hypothetical protein